MSLQLIALFRARILILLSGLLIFPLNLFGKGQGSVSASSLSRQERLEIKQKLSELPTTSSLVFSLLYPVAAGKQFDTSFRSELENILKVTLIEGDTQVEHLTYPIRKELGIDRWVAAFHNQGYMSLTIRPSRSGSFHGVKQNESIRNLKHDSLLSHTHNIYVTDGPVNLDGNPLSLLFHELSHAAFDQWIINSPDKVKNFLISWIGQGKTNSLFVISSDDSIEIDGDLYDLLSERYAFELEYRLNRQISTRYSPWPFSFSFTEEPDDNYVSLIDDYVRRHYDIDHPLLKNIDTNPLDFLLE